MGLNMPAKTCIFTALKKFDGEEMRWMGSGEYIQMSGRAGRRGRDDRGFVFLMVDDSLDESTARAMMLVRHHGQSWAGGQCPRALRLPCLLLHGAQALHPHLLLQGKAAPLVSSFRLSYYTLLNLLRRMESTGANMEYVIAHSFTQARAGVPSR